jgi:hypothetical protein
VSKYDFHACFGRRRVFMAENILPNSLEFVSKTAWVGAGGGTFPRYSLPAWSFTLTFISRPCPQQRETDRVPPTLLVIEPRLRSRATPSTDLPSTGVHLSISTTPDNVDEMAKRARSAGITLKSEPHDTEWKSRAFEVSDPSGFLLAI